MMICILGVIHRMKRIILGAALVLIGVAATPGAETNLPVAPKVFDAPAIDAYLSGIVKRDGIVGLSVAVARDGQVEFAKGYGFGSLENREVVTTNTVFAIGSVTKQFLCACVLLLGEDGKLSVRDKVAKYFPTLTRARDIRLLDLMNNVSGYPDYYPLDFVDRRLAVSIAADELIRKYATGSLDFEPGTQWSYSNTGFIILGRVVEKVTGKPFGDFLKRRILEPLGMKHTTFTSGPAGESFAQGYTSFALSPPEVAQPEVEAWLFTAGGIHSTALDLLKWDLALHGGKVLKPDSYNLMTTPRRLKDGRVTDYGCGLLLAMRNRTAVFEHGGAVAGFVAFNTTIPATRSAVVVLSNFDSSRGPAELNDTLVSLVLQKPANLPKISGHSAADTAAKFFRTMQTGSVDRAQLGEEFSVWLDEKKLRGASERLKLYGQPTAVELKSVRERGGMEVAVLRLNFKSGALRVLMYRTPDGKIQQFFVNNY